MAQGIPSTHNRTTTPLSSGGTFTGLKEQNDFPDVMVSCFSDTDGALFLQFSNDGETWYNFPSPGITVTGGIHEFHTAVKGPRYFRVKFVNSDSTQMVFDLTCYYGQFRQPSAPLGASVSSHSDAIIVRPTDSRVETALGRLSGFTSDRKFGFNKDVDAAAEETLMSQGGTYIYPTVARILNIASSDANDNPTGTGIAALRILGLDSNKDEITEDVILNGLTNVQTTLEYYRVHRMFALTPGSASTTQKNIGNITAISVTDGYTLAYMPAGYGVTQQVVYTVPRGKTALIRGFVLRALKQVGVDPVVTFKMQGRPPGGSWITISEEVINTAVSDQFVIYNPVFITLTEMTDAEVRVSTTHDNTVCYARFYFDVIDNYE